MAIGVIRKIQFSVKIYSRVQKNVTIFVAENNTNYQNVTFAYSK